ncbi:MAG TPA: HU family DNA-binding protein [Actinomycetota bacterium]|nr:HU family DNA-binding protein [Actinomycetota bacterium]
MNKTTLVAEVAKRSDVSRSDVADVVDAVLAVIRERVARGQRVSLAGFGSFERVRRSPRIGRNPRTREAVRIPARNVPVFKPGMAFREAVAARRRTARKAAPRKR